MVEIKDVDPVLPVPTPTAQAVLTPPPALEHETRRSRFDVGQRHVNHAVEGSKAALIPCCIHIPPLSLLVCLSLTNTWISLILLGLLRPPLTARQHFNQVSLTYSTYGLRCHVRANHSNMQSIYFDVDGISFSLYPKSRQMFLCS